MKITACEMNEEEKKVVKKIISDFDSSKQKAYLAFGLEDLKEILSMATVVG